MCPCHRKEAIGLKDHKVAEHNPNTEDVYEDNLLDTHYDRRVWKMFVSKPITISTVDDNGDRK